MGLSSRSSDAYSYEDVRGVSTKILRFKAHLGPKPGASLKDFPVLVMIPGNPGEIEYYEAFLIRLYEKFDRQLDVIGVSHAGHSVRPRSASCVARSVQRGAPNEYSLPTVQENPELYSVQAQISHKLEFVERFIGFERKVILLGHSIGAYIVMQVMKLEPRLKCVKGILLFPVIERIIQTERARKMVERVLWWRMALAVLVRLVDILPFSLKRSICACIYSETHLSNATASFLCKHAINASWFMAKDEFNMVQERDDKFIKQFWELLSFYYGTRDPWCPLDYYKDIRRDYPLADITLCRRNIEHAFVLDKVSVEFMADYAVERCKSAL